MIIRNSIINLGLPMLTNCVNCGAPLHGSKCEYCGTEYNGNNITADFSKDSVFGTLTISGVTYRVYLSETEINNSIESGRGIDGKLIKPIMHRTHKFTLIEG